MKFQVIVPDGANGYRVARCEWPCLPRAGETLNFDGVVSRRDWEASEVGSTAKDWPKRCERFKVIGVDYESDLRGLFATDVVSATVYVEPLDQVWDVARHS